MRVVAAWAAGQALAAAAPQPLPWQRKVSQREAAQSTVAPGTLNPTDPGRSAMSINNLQMHTVRWGRPDRITISVTGNNVWDRRLHEFPANAGDPDDLRSRRNAPHLLWQH